MENKKYDIELEVLTPLCVGAGGEKDWRRGADFVQKNGKVYVLDLQKVAELGISMDTLSSLFLNADERGVLNLLGNHLEDASRYVFPLPYSTTNDIKTFLRSQFFDLPVVAGSSIKGAIRSALFNYFCAEERKDNPSFRNTDKLNEHVFGSMKDGTDFMRFIQVSDMEMPETELVNTKIFNLRKEGHNWYGGWKHASTDRNGDSNTSDTFSPLGFNTLYECIVPNKVGLGSIVLSGESFERLIHNGRSLSVNYLEKKKALMNGGLKALFHVINKTTASYLRKEKAFFDKYPAERSDEVIESINYLLTMIPSDDSSCLLKMSVGVGFHAITGDWLYDDFDDTQFWTRGRDEGKKKYKSRKIAEYARRLQLMGFVRLTKLSEDEASDFKDDIESAHKAILDKRKERIYQQEIERQRVLEEERQRQETKRNQEHYEQLIILAKQFQSENQWKEAIEKAKEAATIMPEGRVHAAVLEDCERQLAILQNIQEQQIRQAEADAEKFSRPLAEVLAGITSAGNLVGTTKKWAHQAGNTFGESECDAFIHALHALPSKEQGRLKRTDLIKAVGDEWAERIIHKQSNNH